MEQLLSSASLTFAPGLWKALYASTPPTVRYFKELNTNYKKRWAVYLLVLEKRSSRPTIYIGSGTNVKGGVSARPDQYDKGIYVPMRVARAMEDGYVIVHKGLLCSVPVPATAMVPILWVLFTALETTFTFIFRALFSKKDFGYGIVDICLWARDSLEYNSLYSYSPLMELPTGDHILSVEELEA